MRRAAFLLPLMASALALPAQVAARETVDASDPEKLSVTVYRDPNRGVGQEMNRRFPRGFAMISETRTVTLPTGESTIRFDGVAEGMVGVTAIVTGLPGGTIEKNRNAELLSPGALVNGALGNRVTITRTNPGTGEAQSEQAIVRTRADGGLVLETKDGFEAVRCAGLPEKLTFDRIPQGLSAKPVFTIDTRDPTGGTYTVTLTYLAWGFDWQADYVATLGEGRGNGDFTMRLLSWLTVLNDNGQSFPDADLLVVAGTINVTSNYQALAQAPRAEPLRLTCFPIGSTARGSPIPNYRPFPPPPPPPPPPPMSAPMAESIMVTGSRMKVADLVTQLPQVISAEEEQLGDLKLYRVPFDVTVAAKGLKQVAFLNKEEVEARYVYVVSCSPYSMFDREIEASELDPAEMLLVTKNEKDKGLGAALPQGSMVVFEPSSQGMQLVSRLDLRDYAVNQDIELAVGESTQVFAQCARMGSEEPEEGKRRWISMRAAVSNANDHPVSLRMVLGSSGEWDVSWPGRKARVKDGLQILELRLDANSSREFDWKIRTSR